MTLTTSMAASGHRRRRRRRLGGAVGRLRGLLALALGSRARVDDHDVLGFEPAAKRLHSWREAEPVSEVLELLFELKAGPRRADLHPAAGRHRVAAVEEVVVEDARPGRDALVGVVACLLGLLAIAGVEGDVVPDADLAVAARAARRRAEVPAAVALGALQRQARAVALEAEVRGERELVLQGAVGARAFEAADAVLGRDVVGLRDLGRVGRVRDHQLDLVVLRVPEDEALRLRGIEPQHLRVHVLGDQPVHPVLERVVGRDAQREPLDVAVAGHAGRRLLELEERDDRAGVALLVAEVRVVAERRLEVQRVLDEPQTHHAAPEVHVGLNVPGDPGEVMRTAKRRHGCLLPPRQPRAPTPLAARPKFAHSTTVLSRGDTAPDVNYPGRHRAGRPSYGSRAGCRAAARGDRGRGPAGGQPPAPGGDRPPLRRQHHSRARGAGGAPARGPGPAARATRRGGLRSDRQRPSRALRDPRRARGARRRPRGGALRPRLGHLARAPARRDARRPAGHPVPRAQPALPHRGLRALGAPAPRRDDRGAARRLERLPEHLPGGGRLPGRPARRRASRDPRGLHRARPRARRRGRPHPPRAHGRARSHPPRDAVKRSTERILTTHTGSLPRPPDLIKTMFAKEEGVPVDRAALPGRVRAAVAEVVAKQARAGIDVVNDGEMSKPSYATYIKDRLEGFGGGDPPLPYQDLVDFPELAKKVFGDPGRSRRRTPACNAPISVRDPDAARQDIRHLAAAVRDADVREAFMNAASPGVVALFFRNDHYPSREEYVHAIAEAMRVEYEAITGAGFLLQIDCPDLGMGRHIQFADASLEEFRREARLNIEALNHATRDIDPERMRMHVCWGNYQGPHHCDVPFADIVDLVFTARPNAIAFEAANPRHAHEWRIFEDVRLPEGKLLIPGVIESKSNFIEHPELIAQRILRYANLVGRENVMAGSDCGYGTWVGQAAVDPDVVWAKLAALGEGAALASRELWG